MPPSERRRQLLQKNKSSGIHFLLNPIINTPALRDQSNLS